VVVEAHRRRRLSLMGLRAAVPVAPARLVIVSPPPAPTPVHHRNPLRHLHRQVVLASNSPRAVVNRRSQERAAVATPLARHLEVRVQVVNPVPPHTTPTTTNTTRAASRKRILKPKLVRPAPNRAASRPQLTTKKGLRQRRRNTRQECLRIRRGEDGSGQQTSKANRRRVHEPAALFSLECLQYEGGHQG